MMNVAVGRLQMSVRWMPRERYRRAEPEEQAPMDRGKRAYQRQMLQRQLDAERADWEQRSRGNRCP